MLVSEKCSDRDSAAVHYNMHGDEFPFVKEEKKCFGNILDNLERSASNVKDCISFR